jgi:hypothetical protein
MKIKHVKVEIKGNGIVNFDSGQQNFLNREVKMVIKQILRQMIIIITQKNTIIEMKKMVL